MIEIGTIQKLEVKSLAPVGVYLNTRDNKKQDNILLPRKQVPEDTKVGDEIEVFVYRDSKDRLIATVNKPKFTLGEFALLKVVENTKVGAFLDWGLEKDLLLPYKEQTEKVVKDKECLVYLYVDKSDRLCATMDIYKYLSDDAPYKENDIVKGTIYSIKKDMGAFVAIDNKYNGLIPKHELHGTHTYGDQVECRVTKVREDGKLNLSLNQKAYIQMDKDSELIYDKLIGSGGFLPFNDKSDPDKIKKEFKMSKNAFKRAVGRLLKEQKIIINDNGIKLQK